MVPFCIDKGDERVVTTQQAWKLKKVPEALAKELEAFAKYRLEALNIHRHGAAVVPVTCANDRATTLRFLGWLAVEREIPPGLGVFGQLELSQLPLLPRLHRCELCKGVFSQDFTRSSGRGFVIIRAICR